MRRLTAHEVLQLAPTLPGTETRAFYEPGSRGVQVLFVEIMRVHNLEPSEIGLAFELAPAIARRYVPARLITAPPFRWQDPTARAFGAGLGEFVRAWGIEAYEAHLADQIHFCEARIRQADPARGGDLTVVLERIRETRRAFQDVIGLD